MVFYFVCKARYGEKFGTLVEVANDELDKDYARERSAATSIAAGEAAEATTRQVATIGQAEVTAAVSAVTAAVTTADQPTARTFSYYAPVNLTFGAGTLARPVNSPSRSAPRRWS